MKSIKTTGNKSAPWWTREFTIQRNKLIAIGRRYQRTKHDNLREARKQQYLQEIRKYEETLKKTKMQSW
jgi:hypothetical protein